MILSPVNFILVLRKYIIKYFLKTVKQEFLGKEI